IQLSGLHLYRRIDVSGLVNVVAAGNTLSIDIDVEGVQPERPDLVGTGSGGGNIAGPTNAEVVVLEVGTWSAIAPVEIDLGVDAGEQRLWTGRDFADHLAGVRVGQFARLVAFAIPVAVREVFSGESGLAVGAVGGEEILRGDRLHERHVGGEIAAPGVHDFG